MNLRFALPVLATMPVPAGAQATGGAGMADPAKIGGKDMFDLTMVGRAPRRPPSRRFPARAEYAPERFTLGARPSCNRVPRS